MKFHANKLAVAVAGCALSLSGFSQAQQLEEVVVTAAKVEASIQDTPIAVTAFSQQALDSQLINDASALQFSVPNLNQTKGNFTAAIFESAVSDPVLWEHLVTPESASTSTASIRFQPEFSRHSF
ncbi:hypothetical protein OAR53_06275 [Luminiphilus sp.]|nr:hypothetical protein [Luminiphilus sp.]